MEKTADQQGCQPGETQEACRRLPAGAQETPGRQPGERLQETPRRHSVSKEDMQSVWMTDLSKCPGLLYGKDLIVALIVSTFYEENILPHSKAYILMDHS